VRIVACRADLVDRQAAEDAGRRGCLCVRVDGRGDGEIREDFEQCLRRELGRVVQFR
jgi:hypothetical protein